MLIDEVLCYIVSKRGRIAEKFMKTIVSNFYNAELIASAKTNLVNAVDMLKPVAVLDSTIWGGKVGAKF